MRFLVAAFAALAALLPIAASAQEATINSPVARPSEGKLKLDGFRLLRSPNQIIIDLVVMDAAETVEIRFLRFTVPSAAGAPCTLATSLSGAGSLANAMNNTRATETGGDARIQQFRILGYLSDRGCLTGITLVP